MLAFIPRIACKRSTIVDEKQYIELKMSKHDVSTYTNIVFHIFFSWSSQFLFEVSKHCRRQALVQRPPPGSAFERNHRGVVATLGQLASDAVLGGGKTTFRRAPDFGCNLRVMFGHFLNQNWSKFGSDLYWKVVVSHAFKHLCGAAQRALGTEPRAPNCQRSLDLSPRKAHACHPSQP